MAKPMTWREEVLDPAGLRAAGRLARALEDGFYLAGGTGLALRLGHRVSLDLDLFSRDNPLGPREREALLERLRDSGELAVVEQRDRTAHLLVGGTSVSLFAYAYPLLAPTDPWRGLSVASELDIAAMKVSAIAGRGSKKDFLDLHASARRLGLEPILDACRRKFADHKDFLLQAARALVFFDDADREPMPRQLERVSWETVRAFFEREVPRLLKERLES